MFKSVMTVVAIAAMLLPGAARAQQSGAAQEDAVGQIQVSARLTYKLASREFDDYAYTYDLRAGNSIRLREASGRYFAHVNNERDVEIFGQSPGVFVSGSGTRFEFRDAGDTVQVTNPGALPGAPRMFAALAAESVLLVSR
jgi:hypothetical protein